MKYDPKLYAKALAEAAAGELSAAQEKKILANFLTLVRKSGDWHNLPKILAAADRELRARTGRRAITIASARNLDTATRKLLASLIRAEDVVREETDPALVAGVRVTIENELQLDGTLARKLNRLFPETA